MKLCGKMAVKEIRHDGTITGSFTLDFFRPDATSDLRFVDVTLEIRANLMDGPEMRSTHIGDEFQITFEPTGRNVFEKRNA